MLNVKLLVGNQLDAQFLRLFQSSACFEQTHVNHQEVNRINTASGVVSICKWPSCMAVEQELSSWSTCIPDGHLQILTTPDALLIQLTSWWLARVSSKHAEDWNKGKHKSVPLQAWSGPEGSRKLRFPDFMTTAQEGGKFVSLTHRTHLPPGNPPGTHFC